MKTNVSIKFNSIEEYREIEKKLEELGYVNDKEWNEEMIKWFSLTPSCVKIYDIKLFCIMSCSEEIKTYNSLEEFLKD